MKKAAILTILFFGTVWGFSEVFLSEALYSLKVPHASVPLTILALAFLTVARVQFPRPGSSFALACCAAAYKCVAMLLAVGGTPMFTCHLLGILLLGAVYDGVFSTLSKRNKSACAAGVVFLAYALFAVSITYVFRYSPWLTGGWPKVLRHVAVDGSLAALGGAIVVPLCFRLGGVLSKRSAAPVPLRAKLLVGAASFVTAALWVVGIVFGV